MARVGLIGGSWSGVLIVIERWEYYSFCRSTTTTNTPTTTSHLCSKENQNLQSSSCCCQEEEVGAALAVFAFLEAGATLLPRPVVSFLFWPDFRCVVVAADVVVAVVDCFDVAAAAVADEEDLAFSWACRNASSIFSNSLSANNNRSLVDPNSFWRNLLASNKAKK